MNYVLFQTEFGTGAVTGDGSGLVSLYLPDTTEEETVKRVLKEYPGATQDAAVLASAKDHLDKYFSGSPVDFRDLPLNISAMTEFNRSVLEMARHIPYGQTRTYKWLASNLSDPKKARAAGNALNKNPLPIIIPCHRIIKSDGELGGFGGGIDWKIRLLRIEKYIK